MIKIFINDEEIAFNKNIEITEELLATSSVILDNCYPKKWEDDHDYISRFYFPKDYSRCDIYSNEDIIFAGVIKNTGEISLNPRYPKFCKLQVLDFKTFLSEGKNLDFVIASKTIEEAIKMVTSEIEDYGFVVGNIMIDTKNELIGAYSTLDKSPYDVYQYISEITNSKWFTRRINNNTIAIDFYDVDKLPNAETIEYNTEYFKENSINDISFSYSTSDYRNKQIVLSNQVFSNLMSTEIFTADGFTSEYLLQNNIGNIKNIYVNNVSQIFITNNDKDLGIDADFYYDVGSNKIVSDKILPLNTQIKVEYVGLINGREIVYNTSEISRINNQLSINGTISRYENRNDIVSSEQLHSIAENYIKFKGKADITLKIETYDKDIFKIGQRVYFNAPIAELKTDYLVKKRKINIIAVASEEHIFYTYELSSNFNAESDINFYDNQRRKRQGNISQGNYISRNIDLESQTNIIFDNLIISELKFDDEDCLENKLEKIL